MSWHTIAKIQLETPHTPNTCSEYPDLKASGWTKTGAGYTKDEEVGRYTLKKTTSNQFTLTIEQLDLFPIPPGEWTPETHPEREKIIQETLSQLEKLLQTNIHILRVTRTAV